MWWMSIIRHALVGCRQYGVTIVSINVLGSIIWTKMCPSVIHLIVFLVSFGKELYNPQYPQHQTYTYTTEKYYIRTRTYKQDVEH